MAEEREREVRAWLRKADDDLRGAQVDLAAAPPLVEDALFHCQQAAEKAMKAFLTAHDVTFRKTPRPRRTGSQHAERSTRR